MAESATFALKAGVWFRRGRLFIVSPDSLGTECPLSGRSSTYLPVQILEAGSVAAGGNVDDKGRLNLHIDVVRASGALAAMTGLGRWKSPTCNGSWTARRA